MRRQRRGWSPEGKAVATKCSGRTLPKPNQNCCICLCVYNNEKGLPYVLNNIKKLDNIFNTKILVFYDHSNDKSLSILNDYNNNNNMEIIINNKKNTNLEQKKLQLEGINYYN